eukprot:Selendium_serpulae@DN5901_c0_g1_i1.p1
MATDAIIVQQNIRNLVQERKQILERLNRRRRGRGGLIGDGPTRAVLNTRSDEHLDGGPSSPSDPKRLKRRRNTEEEPHGDDQSAPVAEPFQVEKRPKIEADNSTTRRNRNLFGNLLGHLKKAKDGLEKEKETKWAELQKKQEDRVDDKLRLEKKNLEELRRRDLKDQTEKDRSRIREVAREIAKFEVELLRQNLVNHYEQMTNFIRTKTEPPLFWLPAVPNSATRQLQKETRTAIETKIESLQNNITYESDEEHPMRTEDVGGDQNADQSTEAVTQVEDVSTSADVDYVE